MKPLAGDIPVVGYGGSGLSATITALNESDCFSSDAASKLWKHEIDPANVESDKVLFVYGDVRWAAVSLIRRKYYGKMPWDDGPLTWTYKQMFEAGEDWLGLRRFWWNWRTCYDKEILFCRTPEMWEQPEVVSRFMGCDVNLPAFQPGESMGFLEKSHHGKLIWDGVNQIYEDVIMDQDSMGIFHKNAPF